MPKLKFYDLQKQKSFETNKFELRMKNTSKGKRYFAIAITGTGKESWRIVRKDFYDKNK